MKISQNWLKEFTEITHSPEEIISHLNASLAEIEDYYDYENLYTGIIVGKITGLKPHPNADKLQVATVTTGEHTHTIVCGASNISVDDYVPVALPGTYLSEIDLKIESRDLRGVTSEGMLCSPKELGISDDHSGILILNDEPHVRVGEYFSTLVKAHDIVYEIENKALTHRPDTFSHLGIAREFSAIFGTKFSPSKADTKTKITISETHPHLSVRIENETLCRRYTAAVIENVTVKPSPLWLQQGLKSVGVRPINNVVDITNFVMLELGQPLHAFDKAKLTGEEIIIRTATEKEHLTTIDGKNRELDPSMLVIADEKEAIAIAGVMGGIDTEISKDTTTIVLESANFEHYNNRKTSRTLGLQTDASIRFSKNQDPNNTLPAITRALELLAELTEGTVSDTIIDQYPTPREIQTIEITADYIMNRIGDPSLTSEKEIISTLKKLAIDVTKNKDHLVLRVPSFRPDLTIKADIVEEIARLKGYDNITLTLPKRDLTPVSPNDAVLWKRAIADYCARLGYSEVYNYSFVGKDLYTLCNVESLLTIPLANPISPDRAFMRPQLLPQLIENINTNRKNFDHAAIFELEKRFHSVTDDLPQEITSLALARYEKHQPHAFLEIKGAVEALVNQLHIADVTFTQPTDDHPLINLFSQKRVAEVLISGESAGILGELAPAIEIELGFEGAVGIAELNADLLFHFTDSKRAYSPVSIHPELVMDISCLVDRNLSLDMLKNSIERSTSELLTSARILESLTDAAKFGEDRKSVTIRLVFQSPVRSLSKADTANDLQNVKTILQENFGAEIRS
ncbi:phenylalanine--tRNA ligase subunit beta [candidate division WWE3 bacterium]|uniref:Phenylalanine--tRNA ligase beta subunit n=1 Tax=candidate division WWE3 bacterium TaxID=2053526 RepID=A0A955LGQ4_UNCKA|nr:phenylalanine--tRNA ligase subunit beta [candidate division WWE3 bacterium]